MWVGYVLQASFKFSTHATGVDNKETSLSLVARQPASAVAFQKTYNGL